MAEETDPPTKYSGQTLGAYRRGKSVSWVPGAVIDVWTPCARMLSALGFTTNEGVTWPHAYFIQTIGDGTYGGMHCQGCRFELQMINAMCGPGRARTEAEPVKKPKPETNQLSLF